MQKIYSNMSMIIVAISLILASVRIASAVAVQDNSTTNSKLCVSDNDACCLGDVCSRSTVLCANGVQQQFLRCTDLCTPNWSCDAVKVCTACVGGVPTGKYGTDGCPLYACPAQNSTLVCCESYGIGSGGVRSNIQYAWMQENQCAIPSVFVGEGKEIVDDEPCLAISRSSPWWSFVATDVAASN